MFKSFGIKNSYFIIITILLLSGFVQQSYAQVYTNGTILGTSGSEIQVISPITADTFGNEGSGFIANTPNGDPIREYNFNRTTSTAQYSAYWTGLLPFETDFKVATPSLTDVQTTVTGNDLKKVLIDNQNTPFTLAGTINTILVKTGKVIQEFFTQSSNIPSSGSGVPVTPVSTPPEITDDLNNIFTGFTINGRPSNTYQGEILVTWTTQKDLQINSINTGDYSNWVQFYNTPYILKSVANPTQNHIPFNIHIPKACDIFKGITINCVDQPTYQIPVKLISHLANTDFAAIAYITVNIESPQKISFPILLLIPLVIFSLGMYFLFDASSRKKKQAPVQKTGTFDSLIVIKNPKDEKIKRAKPEKKKEGSWLEKIFRPAEEPLVIKKQKPEKNREGSYITGMPKRKEEPIKIKKVKPEKNIEGSFERNIKHGKDIEPAKIKYNKLEKNREGSYIKSMNLGTKEKITIKLRRPKKESDGSFMKRIRNYEF